MLIAHVFSVCNTFTSLTKNTKTVVFFWLPHIQIANQSIILLKKKQFKHFSDTDLLDVFCRVPPSKITWDNNNILESNKSFDIAHLYR